MNLHRSDKIADWEKIPPESRNFFQQLAANTKGIVTPGNAVSLAGAGLVLAGLRDINNDHKLRGTLLIGAGRVADIVDGYAADKTGTKSPTGEAVDATLDKITFAAAVPVLLKKDMVDEKLAAFAVVQNLANVALTAVAKVRKQEIHSTWAGKRSTGFLWGAIGMHGLATASENKDQPELAQVFRFVEKTSSVAYMALGTVATSDYYADACA